MIAATFYLNSKHRHNTSRECDFIVTIMVKQALLPKAYYQAFFWVLVDLIVELLVLIIKTFDNQTES
jgi:hypothetical protein